MKYCLYAVFGGPHPKIIFEPDVVLFEMGGMVHAHRHTRTQTNDEATMSMAWCFVLPILYAQRHGHTENIK